MIEKVKNVILVLSGKGGVGKSTVSVQLSLALKESGYKVGLLDIDLCGPSIPYLLGLENSEIYQCENGWLPVYTNDNRENSLAVMSIGFLLKNKNEAVIWRGPKKTAMIKQFLNDVEWGELDYLIIDTPPGTSDEHITIMECMQNFRSDGAIIVTTPQQAALDDVRKEITFCKKTKIPILGIIENMSGFVCPHCSNCTNIFSSDGGKALAEIAKVDLLGTLPIDPRIGVLKGTSCSVITELPDTSTAKVLKDIVKNLNSKLQ
ncbi:cytosolic Fe-S cluster assembly factor NUBP2 homolog [Condylostylus longicornis]|uniref:cytosolic Fe-S cluster assembly factor NUBP2 homolog n=1 Tax=Condylostylus longicornis TaxID=2530218 RepID=UPI00244E578D|nr:cytosolic Fe-S cluster assembly factor NUBP2 homolog [Condylostylus longicornis]